MTEHSPLQEQIIREALNDYRCQYTLCASDDSGSMLVDILTPDGDDVDSGIREMDLLAEHIAVSIDDKIDQLKSENAKLRARMKNTEDILLNEEANPLISDAIKTLRGEA